MRNTVHKCFSDQCGCCSWMAKVSSPSTEGLEFDHHLGHVYSTNVNTCCFPAWHSTSHL